MTRWHAIPVDHTDDPLSPEYLWLRGQCYRVTSSRRPELDSIPLPGARTRREARRLLRGRERPA
jgi:hypothetical protein